MSRPTRSLSHALLLAGLLTMAACGQAPQAPASLSAQEVAAAPASLVNIAQVQGQTPSGDAASPLLGQIVSIEGVVTGIRTSFDNASRTAKPDGFWVQEEQQDADKNDLTSDGVFVFCGIGCAVPAVGDQVRVTGKVGEFFTDTQLQATAADIVVLAPGQNLPPAVRVKLPLPLAERERYEGMHIGTTGVVTGNFTLGRGASFDIADERLYTYTQINRPSTTGVSAYEAEVAARTLRVDDSSRFQNPDPVIFARGGDVLSAENTLRGGDRVVVTGILAFGNDGWSGSGSKDMYRLQATSATVAGGQRDAKPTGIGGRLRAGSMNVLNYFTTLVKSNDGCTLGGVASSARGAEDCTEFLRQRDKIVAAITKMDVDVLGLLEIQNDYLRGTRASVENLVSALNDATAPGTYAAINPGANVGTDAITVAIIYRPANVTPVGQLAVLDNRFDPDYRDTSNRPTLAHTFQSNDNGGRFTAVVAHLKSKGSDCNAIGDFDLKDGQGNCNLTRTNAARIIARWLETNPTGVVEEDRLLMGDLNAYRMEDPIMALEQAGYVSLFDKSSYSYQFDSLWGSLDHALATRSLEKQVTNAVKWHINADEPTVLDYNTNFKTAAQIGSFYAPDPYRSSDHDPLLVGLNLRAQAPIAASLPVVKVNLSPDSAQLTATIGAGPVTQTFSANSFNAPETIALSVTPQNGAPNIVSVPGSVQSWDSFAVTVDAPAGTTPGTYTYALTASAGGASDTSTLTVTVKAPSITLAPADVSVVAGKTTSTTVNVVRDSYSGDVQLTATVSGAGTQPVVSVITQPGTGNSGTIGIDATNATAGTYTVTVTGTGALVGDTKTFTVTVNAAPLPWINEFHYDNAGDDAAEFVEVVVPEGYNAANLQIVRYNGNGGAVYTTPVATTPLTQLKAANGYGIYVTDYPKDGLQNGAPDGIALCDGSKLIQFLSYEGAFQAVGGCADGQLSRDIGLSEPTSTPSGHSLQLAGSGNQYSSFTWSAPTANTRGAVNTGQTLTNP